MRTLTDKEKKDLMDELIQSIKMEREKMPYEVSADEFAEQCGISPSTAKRILGDLVEDGKATKRKLKTDTGSTVVYSML